MVRKLKLLEFSCYMTDVLPSTQTEWKVITPEEGGFSAKTFHKVVTSGQPFLIGGKVTKDTHPDYAIYVTSVLLENGVYYMTLLGAYISTAKSDRIGITILLSYDPVTRILKGRRR